MSFKHKAQYFLNKLCPKWFHSYIFIERPKNEPIQALRLQIRDLEEMNNILLDVMVKLHTAYMVKRECYDCPTLDDFIKDIRDGKVYWKRQDKENED